MNRKNARARLSLIYVSIEAQVSVLFYFRGGFMSCHPTSAIYCLRCCGKMQRHGKVHATWLLAVERTSLKVSGLSCHPEA
jgi:hypothetical protein